MWPNPVAHYRASKLNKTTTCIRLIWEILGVFIITISKVVGNSAGNSRLGKRESLINFQALHGPKCLRKRAVFMCRLDQHGSLVGE